MPFDAMPGGRIEDVVRLRIARDGIAGKRGWEKGELGYKIDAPHCVLGWLLVATERDAREAARLALDYVVPAVPASIRNREPDGLHAIMSYNDAAHTSHKAIVRLLDRAIEAAETVGVV